mmetsp:Transcript_76892/g.199929  ORF Transcript_76892/g.199929 Transcript_76892/m.199929 type:complete len:201 (-) Transcript_76892:2-604(-)
MARSLAVLTILLAILPRCIVDAADANVASDTSKGEETDEQMLKRTGLDLSCSTCIQVVMRFRFGISRHIKPKMDPEEKTKVFADRWASNHPCDEKHFAENTVIAAKQLFAKRKYMSYDNAIKKKGTAISGSGKKVREEAIRTCKYHADGNYDALLAAVINKTKGRMNDVNFYSLVCYKPKLACDANEPELDEDDEDKDEL